VKLDAITGKEVGTLLDFSGDATKIKCCGETGMLSLAFHPNFSKPCCGSPGTGLFYVLFTRPDGADVVGEFKVKPGLEEVDESYGPNPGGYKTVIVITQPYR